MDKLARAAKAFTAALGGASAAAVTAGQDGVITGLEWLTIAGSAVAVGYATWRVPNRQDPAQG